MDNEWYRIDKVTMKDTLVDEVTGKDEAGSGDGSGGARERETALGQSMP